MDLQTFDNHIQYTTDLFDLIRNSPENASDPTIATAISTIRSNMTGNSFTVFKSPFVQDDFVQDLRDRVEVVVAEDNKDFYLQQILDLMNLYNIDVEDIEEALEDSV